MCANLITIDLLFLSKCIFKCRQNYLRLLELQNQAETGFIKGFIVNSSRSVVA